MVWESVEEGEIAQLYRPSKFKYFSGPRLVELLVEVLVLK
jgi:hypothetical protein